MGKQKHVYLGLYDGHLGKEAAEYATTHVHVQIGKALRVKIAYILFIYLFYFILAVLSKSTDDIFIRQMGMCQRQ